MEFKDKVDYITPPLDGYLQKNIGLIIVGYIAVRRKGLKKTMEKLYHEKNHLFALNRPMQIGITEKDRVFVNPLGRLTDEELLAIGLCSQTESNIVDAALVAVLSQQYEFKKLSKGNDIFYF